MKWYRIILSFWLVSSCTPQKANRLVCQKPIPIISILQQTKTLPAKLNLLTQQLAMQKKCQQMPAPAEKNQLAQWLQQHWQKHSYPISEFIKEHSYLYQQISLAYLSIAYGNAIRWRDFAPNGYTTIFYFSAQWCSACKDTKPPLMAFVRKKTNYLMREIDIIDWQSEASSMLNAISHKEGYYRKFLPFLLVYHSGKIQFLGSYQEWLTQKSGKI